MQIFTQENKYTICLVKENELAEITLLLNSAYKELLDMGLNYTAALQNLDKTKERISNGRCFVIKNSQQKILGTILMTVENQISQNNTAYIGQFGVLPEYKKQGLGSTLMKYCENLAQNEGFSGIQLDTAIPAKHLVNWYLKLNYKIIGQMHFENKTYDSYIFEKLF